MSPIEILAGMVINPRFKWAVILLTIFFVLVVLFRVYLDYLYIVETSQKIRLNKNELEKLGLS